MLTLNDDMHCKAFAFCLMTWTLIGCLLLYLPNSLAASFDCKKKASIIEHMICGDAQLSELDEKLNNAYRNALKSNPDRNLIASSQKQWLKRLYHFCRSNECLKGAYYARINVLSERQELLTNQFLLPDNKKEYTKAETTKKLLLLNPMRQYGGKNSHEHIKFCDRLYASLIRKNSKIKYIEPIIRSEDQNDPALGKYLYCDLYNGSMGLRTFELGELGSKGFKVYRLNIDHDIKNGLEEYIYGEDPTGTDQEIYKASFQMVDISQCWITDAVSVRPELPNIKDNRKKNVNALVEYEGNFVIYDLMIENSRAGDMYIWLYTPQVKQFSLECIFRTIP